MTTKQRFYFRSFASGGESPDPAIYCPANGFIPDPAVINLPVVMPELPTDSIIYVCNAATGNIGPNRIRVGGSAELVIFKYEVFDSNGTLVNSITGTNKAPEIIFPSSEGYYTVRITILTEGKYINEIRRLDTTDFPVIEGIKINAPNITLLISAFQYMSKCTVEFVSTYYNVTTMNNAFNSSGQKKFIFKAGEYTYLEQLGNLYAYSLIEELDLSAGSFPVCKKIDRLALLSKYLRILKLPASMPSLEDITQMVDTTPRLQFLQFFTSPLPSTITQDQNIFRYSQFENDIEISDILYNTQCFRWFYGNTFIKNIKFNEGNSMLLLQESFYYCTALESVEFPRTTSEYYSNAGLSNYATALKYFKGPDVGLQGFPSNAGLITITGEHFTVASFVISLATAYRTTLTTFNCPELKCQRFIVGATTNKFTVLSVLEIDWAGSSWIHATSPQLQISAALSSEKLNSIMTALPTVSSGQVADLGYCDGYKDSDHTIANAKGWTVRGFAKIGNGSMSAIAKTTATFNGQMNYLGGYTPVTAGVCFRTTPGPTTANNPKNMSVTAEGAFSVNITTGLAANTTYYARAYATSTYGTVYGDEFTFTTLP